MCWILRWESYCPLMRDKYKRLKLVHMWLDMTMKKGPRLDFFDFIFIVILSIIWKIWMLPLI
ncbi:hypothetical protein FT637_23810 [Bacillus cereus]|nr:hypothetical protein [Bacillus cereus]MBE7105923.1 hypothetical protein [Bacillus cereus]